jgi:hypothetical protein
VIAHSLIGVAGEPPVCCGPPRCPGIKLFNATDTEWQRAQLNRHVRVYYSVLWDAGRGVGVRVPTLSHVAITATAQE